MRQRRGLTSGPRDGKTFGEALGVQPESQVPLADEEAEVELRLEAEAFSGDRIVVEAGDGQRDVLGARQVIPEVPLPGLVLGWRRTECVVGASVVGGKGWKVERGFPLPASGVSVLLANEQGQAGSDAGLEVIRRPPGDWVGGVWKQASLSTGSVDPLLLLRVVGVGPLVLEEPRGEGHLAVEAEAIDPSQTGKRGHSSPRPSQRAEALLPFTPPRRVGFVVKLFSSVRNQLVRLAHRSRDGRTELPGWAGEDSQNLLGGGRSVAEAPLATELTVRQPARVEQPVQLNAVEIAQTIENPDRLIELEGPAFGPKALDFAPEHRKRRLPRRSAFDSSNDGCSAGHARFPSPA